MKLNCRSGYFKFSETKPGQISDYMKLTGFEMVSIGDFFTFNDLEEVPEFSIKDSEFMGQVALVNYEGTPDEIFEANEFVYNFASGLVVPITSVNYKTRLIKAGNHFVADGLIVPGSLTDEGDRIKSYSAWYARDRGSWLYTEVDYV